MQGYTPVRINHRTYVAERGSISFNEDPPATGGINWSAGKVLLVAEGGLVCLACGTSTYVIKHDTTNCHMGTSEMDKSSSVVIRTISLIYFNIWRVSLPWGRTQQIALESRVLSRKGKWQRSDLGFILGSSTATEAGENAKRQIPWLSATPVEVQTNLHLQCSTCHSWSELRETRGIGKLGSAAVRASD